MTTVARGRTSELRRAAVRATLAPSVHNTQPWRLHLTAGRLDVYADRSRRLLVLDPSCRQLLVSCGCAILNARASLAADGVAVDVRRSRNVAHGDLLASITPVDGSVDTELAALDAVTEARRTNRRQFSGAQLPEPVLAELERAAAAEDAFLFVVRDSDQRLAVATLTKRADDIENLNPAYRAELRAWTSDDPDWRDGAPAPAVTEESVDQTLALVGTAGDSPGEWLRAGEALERVLLQITRLGYAATPLTQVIEVPAVRAQLRSELGLAGYPHVLLRIGRAPATPASRRRRLVEVLLEES